MSKLDEIKKALQAATPGPWVADDENGIIWSTDAKVVFNFTADEEEGNVNLIANAPEWLRFLLSELEKRDEENQKLRKELDKQVEIGFSFECQLQSAQQEIKRLKQERAELIEGLRWYADEDTHMIKRRPDGDYAPIVLDHGQRARDILKEIGVTVDV